jgi:uncharacterized membrane protein
LLATGPSLDFATIYLITGTVRVALGFMIVSNLYTSIAYIVHERCGHEFSGE